MFMDEQAKALLEQHDIIVLDEYIEHKTYASFVEALRIKRSAHFELYCNGNGGDVWSSLAIADLIREHGKIIAHLPGLAIGSHVIVFAACSTRYVYPNGSIVVSDHVSVDLSYAKTIAYRDKSHARKIANIMADSSNKNADEWIGIMRNEETPGCAYFDAEAMIEMGLARPIGEYISPLAIAMADAIETVFEELDQFIEDLDSDGQ